MATFLADKSAWARRETRSEVGEAFDPLILKGRVATCGIVDLELLFSARGKRAFADLAWTLRTIPRVPLTEAVFDRALEVQGMLAEKSQHRSVSLPDLVVAACAETHGLTVLHYDADYDRIAKLTGQPTQWIVPRGSVS